MADFRGQISNCGFIVSRLRPCRTALGPPGIASGEDPAQQPYRPGPAETFAVDTALAFQVTTRVGGRAPLHASALGKVLLADLPEKKRAAILGDTLTRYTEKTITDPRKLQKALDEIREQGFALELEEEHAGVGCIGAPVRNALGRWVAAISVAGPLQGTPFKINAAHQQLVVEKAAELSRRVTRD